MKIARTILALAFVSVSAYAAETSAPAEKSFVAPHGMNVSVKMIGPYAQPGDLQIICAFKHKAEGDAYLGAMKDLDAKLGGLLSSLRKRGEFVGELGETLLFTPPEGSVVPARMLVIGLGALSDELPCGRPWHSRRAMWLSRQLSATKATPCWMSAKETAP